MVIPSKESFEQIVQLINRTNTSSCELSQIKCLKSCLRSLRGRNYTGSFGKLQIFAKNDNNGSIARELIIGRELNPLRDKCYNFLYTFGILNLNLQKKGSERYLITEYAPGKPLNSLSNLLDFNRLLSYLQQILLTIEFLNKELGFVHKDLITSNIVVSSTNNGTNDKYKILTIGDQKIYTNIICQIYDFDKSHTYKNPNIDNPTMYYDIFTIIYSLFITKYRNECNDLLLWWGFPEIPIDFEKKLDDSIIKSFLNIPNSKGYLSVNQFIDHCREKYDVDIRRPEHNITYEPFIPTFVEPSRIGNNYRQKNRIRKDHYKSFSNEGTFCKEDFMNPNLPNYRRQHEIAIYPSPVKDATSRISCVSVH